jgi:ubiquinone/menaquinone biosynthesis C-methylase UbiE
MTCLSSAGSAGLYRDEQRVAQRSASLRAAKIAGDSPIDTVIDIVRGYATPQPAVLEVGPGRGSLLLRLIERHSPKRVVAVDRSEAMLDAIARHDHTGRVELLCGDFHQLPQASGSFDVVIAAFALYHSPRPVAACRELLRVCTDNGALVAVTKSADSYRELDELIGRSGLDPGATRRASLYGSFSSESAVEIVAAAGTVVYHYASDHVFHFENPSQAATYAVTVPKYLCHGAAPETVAAALHTCWPHDGLRMTSTVTYLVARPAASRTA